MRIGRDDHTFAIVDVRRLDGEQLNRLRDEYMPAKKPSETNANDGKSEDLGKSL